MSENGSSTPTADATETLLRSAVRYTPEIQAARRLYVSALAFKAGLALDGVDPEDPADMVDRVIRAHQTLGAAVAEIMKADLT